MTGNEMLTTLGRRLEDQDNVAFPLAEKLDALNIAQRTVVDLIDNSYLTELEVLDDNNGSGNAMTGNALDISGKSIIRNGIIAVATHADGKIVTWVSSSDLKSLENTYTSATATEPIAFLFGDTIHVKGTSATATIDIYHIKPPTDLAASGTECSLNIALQEIVLDLAESQLWEADNKSDRANAAHASGHGLIQALNSRVSA